MKTENISLNNCVTLYLSIWVEKPSTINIILRQPRAQFLFHKVILLILSFIIHCLLILFTIYPIPIYDIFVFYKMTIWQNCKGKVWDDGYMYKQAHTSTVGGFLFFQRWQTQFGLIAETPNIDIFSRKVWYCFCLPSYTWWLLWLF